MLPPEARARFLPSNLLCARLNIYKSALIHRHLGPLFMRAFWLHKFILWMYYKLCVCRLQSQSTVQTDI